MSIKKIRKYLTGGFRPFAIRTSNGREFQVPHPEFIALGKTDVVVVDKKGDIHILETLHIASLKVLKGKNGASVKL